MLSNNKKINILNYIKLLIVIYEKCNDNIYELIIDDNFQPYYLYSSIPTTIQYSNHQIDHILNSREEFNKFIQNNSNEIITIAFKNEVQSNFFNDSDLKNNQTILFLKTLFNDSFKMYYTNNKNIVANNHDVLYFNTVYKNNNENMYYPYYLFKIIHQLQLNEKLICDDPYFIEYMNSEKKNIPIINPKNILELCIYLSNSNKIKYFYSSLISVNDGIVSLFSKIFNIPVTYIFI
jgi:hypothetical protein